jgi:transposase InsO family protein
MRNEFGGGTARKGWPCGPNSARSQQHAYAVCGRNPQSQGWSMNFIYERTEEGRSFRVLGIIDQFTRECVSREADRSMTGRQARW